MRKKRILYQSDFSLAKTGFGRCSKALLTYLHNTGKYEIYHYCCGVQHTRDSNLRKTPWRSAGTLPDIESELQALNKDPNLARRVAYGSHLIDKVIEEFKPDVYFAVQDIWGIDFALEKPWFDKISSVFWTTLDSRPILPSAIAAAPKTKNYWIWSNFATKEFHKLGHNHVKTVHGPVDTKFFHKLPDSARKQMREKFNIDPNTFIIGFVFRNQLRKSIPNLIEGYANWKYKYKPKRPTALLLHTHFGEGWEIVKLAKEYKVPLKEILTTYICKACKNYQISPFTKVERNCDYCGSEKSQITTNVGAGVTELQLNDVYNMMDVYCHPFTSGGQEYPIQEAKLCQLITLVTNYSCGEEMCENGAGSLPLEWSEYREHGTQFIKASTDPKSIASQLNKVFKMKPENKQKMELQAREWAWKNYSAEVVGEKIEKFIDSCDYADYDKITLKAEKKDPFYKMPQIEDQPEWIIHLYKNILKVKVDENDDGFKYWTQEIGKGMPREDVEKHFRKIAMQEDDDALKRFESLLDNDDEGRRILYVMPEGINDVFLSTSLFESIKEQYPECNLYVSTTPECAPVLDGNPHVHKVIGFDPQLENLTWLEGVGDHKGYFKIAFLPHLGTKKSVDYLHNGEDKIAFDIKD